MRTLARESDAARLLERLGRVTPTSQRRWGRMSAHQMICHVADSFRMALGEKATADISTLFSRTAMKWIALRAPVPWPPGRIRSSRELDQEIGGTRPQEFEADRREAEALLRRMAGAAPAPPRHPIFGDTTWEEWLRWGYLHTDHHLRQFGV